MRQACDWLLAPRPIWLLLLLSAAIAALGCATLFDAGFIAGTSAYWEAPGGIEGGSLFDIPGVLSADQYFIRESWRLPLFHINGLGAPEGANAILVGSVPTVALIGRLLFEASGHIVNLYGLWTVLAYLGSGIAMSLLVALLGARGLAACVMATITGAFMPELLARWGHIPLLPQGLICVALACYVVVSGGRTRLGLAGLFAASLLALLSQAYLFVMVAAIALATLAQAVLDGRLRVRVAFAILAAAAVPFAAIVVGFGYLGGGSSLSGAGFGYYSLNPLALLKPQMSGLLPPFAAYRLEATGGQYEGFSYLGAGLLILLPFAAPRLVAAIWRNRRRHAVLLALLTGCLIFALSNQITIAPGLGVIIPLPAPVIRLASICRSTGRFVWPVMFALAAALIAATPRRFGRMAAPILLAAALLQWLDGAPLRHELAASVAAPMPMPLDLAALHADIAGHAFVRMIPSYACTDIETKMSDGLPRGLVSVEVELAAARAGIPTNTFYAARQSTDCEAELARPPVPGELRIYLRGAASPPDPSACRAAEDAFICDR